MLRRIQKFLFGSSAECELIKADGWGDPWSVDDPSLSPETQAHNRADFDGDGASNIVEYYGASFVSISIYDDLQPGPH